MGPSAVRTNQIFEASAFNPTEQASIQNTNTNEQQRSRAAQIVREVGRLMLDESYGDQRTVEMVAKILTAMPESRLALRDGLTAGSELVNQPWIVKEALILQGRPREANSVFEFVSSGRRIAAMC